MQDCIGALVLQPSKPLPASPQPFFGTQELICCFSTLAESLQSTSSAGLLALHWSGGPNQDEALHHIECFSACYRRRRGSFTMIMAIGETLMHDVSYICVVFAVQQLTEW